jgi:hypothetical protein
MCEQVDAFELEVESPAQRITHSSKENIGQQSAGPVLRWSEAAEGSPKTALNSKPDESYSNDSMSKGTHWP